MVLACEGVRDSVLGVVWPAMRVSLGVSVDGLGLLLTAFGVGYVIVSAAAGRILRWFTLRPVISSAVALMAASLWAGGAATRWPVVLGCLLVCGLGAGAFDAAVNTYAATVGGRRVMSRLQAAYSAGAVLGPALGGVLHSMGSWRSPFMVIAAVLSLLTVPLFFSTRNWEPVDTDGPAHDVAGPSVFAPNLAVWVCLVMFMLYSGLELAIGLWSFTLFTEWQGRSLLSSAGAVSIFWTGIVVSRSLLSVSRRLPSSATLVRQCLLALTLAVLLFVLHSSTVIGIVALLAAGLAAGPIFPTLMSATVTRANTNVATMVGWQTAAATGGQVIVPAAIGVLDRALGLGGVAGGLVACCVLAILLHEALEIVSPPRWER